MKYTIFAIISFVLLIIISANADKQMNNTPHETYCQQLKVWHPDCKIE